MFHVNEGPHKDTSARMRFLTITPVAVNIKCLPCYVFSLIYVKHIKSGVA